MENVKIEVTLDEAKFLSQVMNKVQVSGKVAAVLLVDLINKIEAVIPKEKPDSAK